MTTKRLKAQNLLLLLSLISGLSLQAQDFKLIDKGAFTQDRLNTNGASFVDIDNDGDLDLFLTNANLPFGANTIYRNDGDDMFTQIEAGELTALQVASFGHSWADYDNDGLMDVFIANGFTRFGSLLYKNLGNFQFRRIESYNTANVGTLAFDAAWADYDNDGFVDLVTIHPANFVGKPVESNALFRNENGRSFSYQAGYPITGPTAPFTNATWTDYDLDGDMDLFIGAGPANGTVAPDFHFRNMLKESGQVDFQRITNQPIGTDGMDGQTWNWIDYDNDGDLDAFMTNYSGLPNPQGTPAGMLNCFYRNDGDTLIKITEGPLVEELSVSLANVWADFDNDGYLDVIVGNAQSTNKLYHNNGDGTFTYVSNSAIEAPGPKNTWGMTYGDYDNDGDQDLYITCKTGYVAPAPSGAELNYLYRNDLSNGNHWFTIKCVGSQSNQSAIGTIVRLRATINGRSMTQTRVIGSNNTFLGDNDIRAHFGLGNASTIERIEIQWPSGVVDQMTNVSTNQIMTITEGQTN